MAAIIVAVLAIVLLRLLAGWLLALPLTLLEGIGGREALPHIDIGSWFAPEFSRERTPTLRQALELAHGRAGVVIELKYYGRDKELESRVAKVVESGSGRPRARAA